MVSKIFLSDVSTVISDPARNKSPYCDDDLTILHIFNAKAEGMKSVSLRVQLQDRMSHAANLLGGILELRQGVKYRVGLVGVKGTGKSSFALDMLKRDEDSMLYLKDKLIRQKQWNEEISSVFYETFFTKREANDFPVAHTRSHFFGECAIVDLCAVLHEELHSLSDGDYFDEEQRSPKEVDVMNNADLLIAEHPDVSEFSEADSQSSFDILREIKGYDVLVFINKLKDSEERHITLVVPENGVLSKKFDVLKEQISQDSQVQVIQPSQFGYY